MNPILWILLMTLSIPSFAFGRVRKIEVKSDQIITVRTAIGVATIIQVPDRPNSIVVGDQAGFTNKTYQKYSTRAWAIIGNTQGYKRSVPTAPIWSKKTALGASMKSSCLTTVFLFPSTIKKQKSRNRQVWTNTCYTRKKSRRSYLTRRQSYFGWSLDIFAADQPPLMRARPTKFIILSLPKNSISLAKRFIS